MKLCMTQIDSKICRLDTGSHTSSILCMMYYHMKLIKYYYSIRLHTSTVYSIWYARYSTIPFGIANVGSKQDWRMMSGNNNRGPNQAHNLPCHPHEVESSRSRLQSALPPLWSWKLTNEVFIWSVRISWINASTMQKTPIFFGVNILHKIHSCICMCLTNFFKIWPHQSRISSIVRWVNQLGR